MTPVEAIEIGKDAIYILLKISLPLMLVAMGVGLIISLIQALTQIQEMTLSFVPKIIAIFVAMILLLPYIYTNLSVFMERLQEKIIGM